VSALKRSETYSFRTVDYEILINTDGWDKKILNAGFYSYKLPGCDVGTFPNGFDPDKEKKFIMVEDGLAEETSEPNQFKKTAEPVSINLNGVDRYQHDRWLRDNPGGAAFVPHFRWFRHLTRTSFTALGFT
jgi:hypothetical protein